MLTRTFPEVALRTAAEIENLSLFLVSDGATIRPALRATAREEGKTMRLALFMSDEDGAEPAPFCRQIAGDDVGLAIRERWHLDLDLRAGTVVDRHSPLWHESLGILITPNGRFFKGRWAPGGEQPPRAIYVSLADGSAAFVVEDDFLGHLCTAWSISLRHEDGRHIVTHSAGVAAAGASPAIP